MVQEGLSPTAIAWILIALSYILCSYWLAQFLRSLDVSVLRRVQWVLSITVGFHLLSILRLFLYEDWEQPSLIFASSFFSSLAATVCWFFVFRRLALGLILFALPFTGAGMILAPFVYDSAEVIQLPSLWLWVHVLMMITGELFLFFAACSGLTYLVAQQQIRKRGELRLFTGQLWSLPTIDAWSGRLLGFGLFLLSGGFLLGILFAKEFWSGEWWRDPKVTFTLLTWLLYLILLFIRSAFPAFKGWRSAVGVVMAFLVALALSLSTDLFFESRHGGAAPESQESLSP